MVFIEIEVGFYGFAVFLFRWLKTLKFVAVEEKI
jgi:hypothetical protein